MESDGLSIGLASPDLLEKIDGLFACKVGEYVDLPQLVVVGDQSSGKSSVLEALTNLPFPRESGLCTRFATQIIFRRSQETHVSVSVIPAENATEEHKAACCSWTTNELQSLDAESFANIMKQVCQLPKAYRNNNPAR
jgi:GTPase SAR1 family protein